LGIAIEEENHYGFRLSDELILLRDQIRRFMREEVKPIEDTLPHDAIGCGREDRVRLRAMAEEMGLTRLTVPEDVAKIIVLLGGAVLILKDAKQLFWSGGADKRK
jgi:acyl-CoA dehydrogenase